MNYSIAGFLLLFFVTQSSVAQSIECEPGFVLKTHPKTGKERCVRQAEIVPEIAPAAPATASIFDHLQNYQWQVASAAVGLMVPTWLYFKNRNTRHEFSDVDDYLNALPDLDSRGPGLGNFAGDTPREIGERFKTAAQIAGINTLKKVDAGDPSALARVFQRVTDPAKIAAFWAAFYNPSPKRKR